MNAVTQQQRARKAAILKTIRTLSQDEMLKAVRAIEATFGRAPQLEQLRAVAMQSVTGGAA